MDDHVARRKRIFGLGMLVVGAVVYLVGLWRGCHTLSEKGYFFAAIVMCGFPVLIRQEHTGNDRLLSRCKSLLLLGIGMVAVGVFNLALAGALKILCLVALGVSIYGTDLYASYSDDE
ncbi:Inner membrane protein YiaB [Salmonella enterica subsp. enterica serovar Napoli]|nr:Inner membrane protein YiaB [Salmonella enterica subsp. enterica serovar Napoli]